MKNVNNQITEVYGEYVNPYAHGHKINHPPPNTQVNVTFIDCLIPYTFFPQHYLRYLPYIKYSRDSVNLFKF